MIFRFARVLSQIVHTLPSRNIMLKAGIFGGLTILMLWQGLSVLVTASLLLAVYLLTGGWAFAKIVVFTLPRDARGLTVLLYLKWRMKRILKSGGTVVSIFEETVQRHPNKVAFVLVDGNQMTFKELDMYSNQVANYLQSMGYKKGDVCAILMDNCPEYVGLWLGMAKIGVNAALINFNLRMDSLAHCIRSANADCIIYGDNYAQAVSDAHLLLPSGTHLYCMGNYAPSVLTATHLDPLIADSSTICPPRTHNTRFNEKLFYIFTSGTTGLPKAAIVTHSRYFYMASTTHIYFYMNCDDVIYNMLPLYHTAGGTLGTGQALIRGCTVVLRKKFSASRFWDDCVKHDCTVTQYIGELCRYLLAQPDRPAEHQHRVRTAFGNGLRPQIWTQFMKRFGIDRIGEFYGATEGNANIVNIDNKVGSVGFCTQICPPLYPVKLIRTDHSTGEPMRDDRGLCIVCKPGEPGELVGKIIKGDPIREFDGYTNKDATKKKIAYNVFSQGDSAFVTGDILVMDELGYMYFKDRTGDTFRWRGENVSTAEVEATISNIVKLSDTVVYGVELPGSEGRAGMAAIADPEGKVDLEKLYSDLQRLLPAYACPLFVRLLSKVDTTSTFKLKKVDLRNEGFDPSKISDQLYYLDVREHGYKPITAQTFTDIHNGQIRL